MAYATDGIGRGNDVDVLGQSELTASIARDEVVVSHALAALVELRGLEGRRERDRRSGIRRARGLGSDWNRPRAAYDQGKCK
jgi:hypothetical protein